MNSNSSEFPSLAYYGATPYSPDPCTPQERQGIRLRANGRGYDGSWEWIAYHIGMDEPGARNLIKEAAKRIVRFGQSDRDYWEALRISGDRRRK